MKVIDDFMPKDYFLELQEFMLGTYMPWFYNPYIAYESDIDKFQFTHTFLRDNGNQSDLLHILNPIFEKIEVKELISVKANLGTRDIKNTQGGWHVDYDVEDIHTAVFYINTTNGYTLFEDGTKVESKENRFASFTAQTKHTGVSHTDTQVRVVLNMNYKL